jgi:hypothetical protein
MRPTAQEGTTVTTTLRAAGPRTLSAILAASAIALACVACSPGGSGATPGDTSPTTSSDAASAPADDGASDQGDQGTTTDQGGSADQGSSAGASKEALCNDLEGADLNGDSDEDTENGVAIWNQMVGHAPGDIKGAVQTVSDGLNKALAGDPSVAQSDAWGQALLQVSQWEIANCQG